MKLALMTLFLLLSLSYSSAIECYDTGSLTIETEKLYENMKEEIKKDSTIDSLDILLTMKCYCLSTTLTSLRIVQVDNYNSVYSNPLYKPPQFS